MRVDREVELRQAREMAHRLQLRHLGQRRRGRAAQVRRDLRRARRCRLGRGGNWVGAARPGLLSSNISGSRSLSHACASLGAARSREAS